MYVLLTLFSNTARDHVNAVVAGGKLYVAGGRDSGAANYPDFFTLVEKKVDVFDFKTNKWSTLTTPFPRPRAGAPVVVWKGKPLVAGGEGSGRAWSEVDTLSGDKFVPFAKMMRPRHGFGMVACSGVLWTAGGAGTQGGGKSQLVLDAYYEGKRPAPCNFVLAKPGKSPVGPPVLPPGGNGTDPTPVGESPAPGESPGPDTPNGQFLQCSGSVPFAFAFAFTF